MLKILHITTGRYITALYIEAGWRNLVKALNTYENLVRSCEHGYKVGFIYEDNWRTYTEGRYQASEFELIDDSQI